MARMRQRGDPDEAESGLASRAAVETTGARILRGSRWAGASSVIPLVYVLVASIAAARYLGPDGMGRQSYIAFLELSLTALLSSGISTSLMRHIGEALGQGRPEAARGMVAFAWRLQLGAALVGGASSPPQESPAPTRRPHGCSPASAPRSACSTRCRAPS
jgi:hypothetical protein